jgi:hypothetical protein
VTEPVRKWADGGASAQRVEHRGGDWLLAIGWLGALLMPPIGIVVGLVVIGRGPRRSGIAMLCVATALLVTLIAVVAAPAKGRYCGASVGLGVFAHKTHCSFANKVARRYLAVESVELDEGDDGPGGDGLYGLPPRTLRVYDAKAERRVKMRCRTVTKPDSPYMVCTGGKRRVEIRS